MKRLLCVLLLAVSFTCCAPREASTELQQPSPAPEGPSKPDVPMSQTTIRLTISGQTFAATLNDNAAARAFAAQLPITVQMHEHAGNEKYASLPVALTTVDTQPGTIHRGDLMLFGNSTLVLFYDTFDSSYSYTPIGKITNPAGLAEAAGQGSITVEFKIEKL